MSTSIIQQEEEFYIRCYYGLEKIKMEMEMEINQALFSITIHIWCKIYGIILYIKNYVSPVHF